jgi:hypothetical protein
MRLSPSLFLILTLIAPSVRAETVSAIRSPQETWQKAAAREGRTLHLRTSGTKEAPVQDVAEDFWSFDSSDVPLWTTREGIPAELRDLQDQFLAIRDERIHQDPEDPGRLRRIAFLFPDDGCHLRAALFNQSLERKGYARGYKIFAFGDLRVPTPHHPDGDVLWWFHVAPIFRVKEGLFVADPALFPAQPVPLKQWLKFLAPENDITKLRMVSCDAYAHSPHSRCMNGSQGTEEGAFKIHNREFLGYEWRRQVKLGRDPEKILGDFPPWRMP